jgi:hypothetical protein
MLENVNHQGHFQNIINELLTLEHKMVTKSSNLHINSTCPHQEFKSQLGIDLHTEHYMANNLTRLLGQAEGLDVTSDDLALIMRLKTASDDKALALQTMLSPLCDMFN